MRALLLTTIMLAVALISGTLLYAPYLPRLVLEGAPPLIWSGAGTYTQVDGPQPGMLVPLESGEIHAPNSDLTRLFEDSNGMALLVALNGNLELEHYASDIAPQTLFNSYSMAKSLVGALVFKAIAEGRIAGLDNPIGSWLPENQELASLTIRALLTMRSGISFEDARDGFGSIRGDKVNNDITPSPFGALAKLHFQGFDAVEPGLRIDPEMQGEFAYQNVNTAILAHVLEAAYELPIEVLLSEKIWRPAGAETAYWRRPSEDDPVSAYCCLFATPKDFLRVGVFLSNNGTAEQPFLPEVLWRTFLGLDVPYSERRVDHYGFHVHQDVLDREGEALQGDFSYFVGQNGQMLYLMPQSGLVVYRAGDGQQLLHSTLYAIWNSIEGQR